jgi:branched-chain amino acid transport system permease protein
VGFSLFVQHLSNGIALGAMYALIAVGYTIIYGVVGLMNLAHGDVFMVAGFLALWGVVRYSLPSLLSFAIATFVTVAVAIIIQRVVYKPLLSYKISLFTAAFATSVLLENLVIVLFTARAHRFPRPTFAEGLWQFGEITIPILSVIVIVVAGVMFLLLMYVITRTKMGRAMRALSKDMEATALMGVNTDQVITFAFALSALFATVGAFMWGFRFPTFQPFSGVMPGLKGFIGAVMGGIGNIPGALLGGFLLGLGEIMLVAFLPYLSGWRDALAFGILIIFLLFRPGGLFNVKVVEEKV